MTPSPTTASTRSSVSFSHRTTRRCPSPSISTVQRQAADNPRPAVHRHRELGDRTRLSRLFRRGRPRWRSAHPDMNGHEVVFTAHSLPQRILDRRPLRGRGASATATLVADRAGLADDRWSVAWQSAGRTSEPWLGTDLLGVIDALRRRRTDRRRPRLPVRFRRRPPRGALRPRYRGRKRAETAGLTFRRTTVVNDDSGVMSALARRIVAAAGGS